jgi:hypothetical protein
LFSNKTVKGAQDCTYKLSLMTVFGNGSSVIVYYDLKNILTFSEIKSKTSKRFCELVNQGFTKDQAIKIIFECADFKDSFLDLDKFNALKDEF